MKKSSFLFTYCIIEFLVSTVLLCIGIWLKYSSFPSDFVSFINNDIDHPIKTSNVSYPSLILIFIIFGIVMGVLFALNKFNVLIIKVLNAYYFSISFSFLIAAFMQRIIGRPKPDTNAYCGSTFYECSKVLKKKQLNEQFRSFPSLYTTLSMNSGIFLSLLLSELWGCYNMLAVLVKLIPTCYGLFVGISQIWNRTNHIDDVLTGMLIGTIIAFFTANSLVSDIRFNFVEFRHSSNEMSTASGSTTSQKLFQGYV